MYASFHCPSSDIVKITLQGDIMDYIVMAVANPASWSYYLFMY